jgi:cation:H+ antiporter
LFPALIALLSGIGLLAYAADQFVLGAARVALIKRVRPLVVGVLIVGFGTSLPEMLVSAIAAAGDQAGIAVGNIVGSNLANLSLLLGIGAVMVPLVVDSRTVRQEATLAVGAAIIFAGVVQGGGITPYEGGLLLALMVGVLYLVTRRSPGDPLGPETVELTEPAAHRIGVEALRTVLGLAGTVGGAQALLWGAVDLAERAGLSNGFVGATIVAVGTSLPELVTVVQSARRGETDLIVGNLLGSNLFNALVVGGAVGLLHPAPIEDAGVTLVAPIAAVVVSLLALLAMRTEHTVTRLEGALLIVAYAATVPFLA